MTDRRPVVIGCENDPEIAVPLAAGQYTVVADEYLTVADFEFQRHVGEWRWSDEPDPLRTYSGSAVSDDDLVLLVPGYTVSSEGAVLGGVFLGRTPEDVTARYQGKTYRLVEVE